MLKKLAFVLVFGIAVFSGLAVWQESKNRSAALAAEEAAAALGQRPGGIVINMPNIQEPAAPSAIQVPATPSGASSASGESCP